MISNQYDIEESSSIEAWNFDIDGDSTQYAAEAALSGAAALAAPGAAPAAVAVAGLGRRSGGRSLRSGHQRNAGARDTWRQELTGAKFAAAGAAATAAGTGINAWTLVSLVKTTGARFTEFNRQPTGLFVAGILKFQVMTWNRSNHSYLFSQSRGCSHS